MKNIEEKSKFQKVLTKAEEIVESENRLTSILTKSLKKVTGLKDHLSEMKNKITMSVYLVKDWVKGDYREVPKKTIVYIVAALIYFVMPLDIIPDFVFKLGLVDDLAVLNYVFSSFLDDINKYQKYREKKEKEKEALEQETKKEDRTLH